MHSLKSKWIVWVVVLFVSTQIYAQNERPNIILMMADDLGFGDVGFTANNTPNHTTPIQTPNLDMLAGESMELLNFYSIGPVCSPTRGSFLTGRHYARFGIFAANEGVFPSEEISLARICKEKGYATGHFGKWHIGTLDPNHSPKPDRAFPQFFAPPWERDYDVSFVTESSISTWDPISSKNPYYENGVVVTDNNTLLGDDSKVMMDRVVPFIENAVNNDTPFLSVVWFHAPHEPFVAGPSYKEMYSAYSEDEQNYFGCITAMDDQVGRLQDKLEELGIDDNTILLFCSDNGPEKNKPGETGGLRDRKRSLYNGGVLVPAFIKWPGKTDTPSESTYQTSVLDLFPTVMDIIDYDMPDDRPIDGTSLIPMLNGDIAQRENAIPFLHSKKMAWIDGDYKFRLNVHGEPTEAYNMILDRNETTNLIGSFDAAQKEAIEVAAIEWNCSSNWSYWGYDFLPDEYTPVDNEWKGLREVTCDEVPTNPMSLIEYQNSGSVLFEVFPNPTKNRFVVKGILEDYKIHVFDAKGNNLLSTASKDTELSIDISSYPKGFYLITLEDKKNGAIAFQRIVIKQ